MVPKEIIGIFEKYNIDIQLVFVDGRPQLDFCYEDEHGQSYELDGFWEDRIKHYHLERFE